MYRLIILFGICWALTDVHAADYEINLSVLNSLGQENIDQELPIPSIETPKTQKKTIERAAKKTAKETTKKDIKKNVVKKETPKKKLEKENLSQQIATTDKVKETKIETQEDKKEKEEKTPVIESVTEQKTETPKTEVAAEIVTPLVPVSNLQNNVEEKISSDDGIEDKSTLVSFADDSDELNEEIIRRLNLTINKLGADYSGKFLIEAYNYDNDGGIFSRKRLSLNRAVAVRSYLLGEGYKSFSIKIINTEDASLKNNVLISY